MLKRILLALGGTPFSHAAVERALALAQTQQAGVTAAPILDRDLWKSALSLTMSAGEAARIAEARPWAAAEQRLRSVVDRFRQACDEAGVAHEVVEPQGDPFEQLISEWRYHDLLVFGLRGLFDHSLVPEPEQAVAKLIGEGVRPIIAAPQTYRTIGRVLIAYSGSMESAKAMKQFAQMQLWPEAAVHLACFNKPADEADSLLTEGARYLRAHGFSPTTEAVSGSALSTLLPYAERIGADLIVLGSSYRNVLVSSVLGDIMLDTTRRSEIPLFLSH